MKHVAVERFSELYNQLPVKVRRSADHSFGIVKERPDHPVLRMVRQDGIWSMRIGSRHRALAVEHGETVIWFWIGTYSSYTTAVM